MKRISTHILDTSRGKPAVAVTVRLERCDRAGDWRQLSSSVTDADGRCTQLLPETEALSEGTYRLTFETADYFSAQGVQTFYPYVEVAFRVGKGESDFHIPLLVSPHGYITYRGT